MKMDSIIMREIPFHYRIKKLIQRTNPIEFIKLVDGRYYWSFDGDDYQLSDLLILNEQHEHDPRTMAIIDKGITCLRQIDGYLTWLGNEGLSEFMHSGSTPFPPIPDWLVWHELQRLPLCKCSAEINIYIKQNIDILYRVAKTYPPHQDGWLIYSGCTADYVLTPSCVSLKYERSEDVVTHVCFGNARGNATPSRGSKDGVRDQCRTDESSGVWPLDAGR